MTTKPLVVATNETKPSDQRTAQIAQLLAQAGRDVAALRLTVPASGNAFAKYREVLVLDPENSQALNGIASIVYKFVQLIDRAIETRRFGLADLYLRRVVTILPENRNLRRTRETGEPPRVREFPSALSSPVQAQADPPPSVDPPGAGQPQSQVSQDGRSPRVSDPQATDDASASSETNVRTFDTSMTTKALVVATDETKQSNQRTAQIAQLLAQADQDVAAMRLTVPASGNAFAKYREVLVLDPENSQALNGIASIVYKYVQLLDRAIEMRRFGLADLYLRRAVTLFAGESEPSAEPGKPWSLNGIHERRRQLQVGTDAGFRLPEYRHHVCRPSSCFGPRSTRKPRCRRTPLRPLWEARAGDACPGAGRLRGANRDLKPIG